MPLISWLDKQINNKLVRVNGILSSPNLKPGKTLPAATEELVLIVYHNDEISRAMPGRKDLCP